MAPRARHSCVDARTVATPLNWDDFRFFLAVARTGRTGAAASSLKVDYTTVGRRIRGLENSMRVLLFEKSRTQGYTLTPEGQRLLAHAEAIEHVLDVVRSDVQGEAEVLRGHIRIGTSEGFGSFVLAPQLRSFQRRYPEVRLDLLPVSRFVSLPKREADVAVNIEPPKGSAYVRAR